MGLCGAEEALAAFSVQRRRRLEGLILEEVAAQTVRRVSFRTCWFGGSKKRDRRGNREHGTVEEGRAGKIDHGKLLGGLAAAPTNNARSRGNHAHTGMGFGWSWRCQCDLT